MFKMLYMRTFYQNIEALFQEASEKFSLSRNKLLIAGGVDPANYMKYKREGRILTLDQLRGLSEVEQLNVSYAQLVAWKLSDEYSPEALKIASEISRERDGQ